MATFTLYHGRAKPLRGVGRHCVRLAMFAEKYTGWHTFVADRTTRRAVATLLRLGCIEVSGDQFRFTYPKGN